METQPSGRPLVLYSSSPALIGTRILVTAIPIQAAERPLPLDTIPKTPGRVVVAGGDLEVDVIFSGRLLSLP
jgi:hypothetical protein